MTNGELLATVRRMTALVLQCDDVTAQSNFFELGRIPNLATTSA